MKTEKPGAVHDDHPLSFRIDEGTVQNAFYRSGPVSAHVLVSSGMSPRLIVAFPAGNSGAGVWFERSETPVDLRFSFEPYGVSTAGGLYGVTFGVESAAAELRLKKILCTGIRILRDYIASGAVPALIRHEISVTGDTVQISRERLDGGCRYETRIRLVDGTVSVEGAPPDEAFSGRESAPEGGAADAGESAIVFRAAENRPLKLEVSSLTGEPPLTPLSEDQLLKPAAAGDPQLRSVLAFLSYREKLLAGSWRFLTYFGRDTLILLHLMMPVLTSEGTEAGLRSVFERMNTGGEAAHEEDVGEFAVLRRALRGENVRPRNPAAAGPDRSRPLYDYRMIDDDFLVLPVAAAYLLNTGEGRSRASSFLAEKSSGGKSFGELLLDNIRLVLANTAAYAAEPAVDTLVPLRPDEMTGNWRDSPEGLGLGRIPFDVNGALVPAALAASIRLLGSGIPVESSGTAGKLIEEARRRLSVWEGAGKRFEVRIPAAEARERVRRYARFAGVPSDEAAASIDEDVVFPALAIDENLNLIPVLNSDAGFVLFYGNPPEAELLSLVKSIFRPFPAGLKTTAGFVVANPAFTDDEQLYRMFGRNSYHGCVVWSWQQALLAAGIALQRRRTDLSARARGYLSSAERGMWEVIGNMRKASASELWSWSYRAGEYRAVPFGQESGHADEANAAQLWSTVYLAVQPPAGEPPE